jgi:hypothetical protein
MLPPRKEDAIQRVTRLVRVASGVAPTCFVAGEAFAREMGLPGAGAYQIEPGGEYLRVGDGLEDLLEGAE